RNHTQYSHQLFSSSLEAQHISIGRLLRPSSNTLVDRRSGKPSIGLLFLCALRNYCERKDNSPFGYPDSWHNFTSHKQPRRIINRYTGTSSREIWMRNIMPQGEQDTLS